MGARGVAGFGNPLLGMAVSDLCLKQRSGPARLNPVGQELHRVPRAEMMAEIGGTGDPINIRADRHAFVAQQLQVATRIIGNAVNRRRGIVAQRKQ